MAQKRIKKKAKEERIFNLFSNKLINYRKWEDTNEWIKGLTKSKANELIKEQTKSKYNAKILSKDKEGFLHSFNNGWVRIEEIEDASCPYSTSMAEKKRYSFLNAPEIQKDWLRYQFKTKRYKTRVYRLNPYIPHSFNLFKLFYENEMIYDFMESDYFKDSDIKDYLNNSLLQELALLRQNKDYIVKALRDRLIFPPSLVMAIIDDKDFLNSKQNSKIFELIKKIGFANMFFSFLLVDYVNCDNPKYKQLYEEILFKETGGK